MKIQPILKQGEKTHGIIAGKTGWVFSFSVRATLGLVMGLPGLAGLSIGPVQADRPIRVVTTTSDLAHFAKRVGEGRVQVENLVSAGSDPHYVDARPDFILKANRADVFCQVGMGLEEGWVPVIQRQAKNGKIRKNGPGYCDASVGIRPLEVPDDLSRSQGHLHAYGNPHYHLDPVNAVVAARNIRDALIRVDPGGADFYRSNFQTFASEVEEFTVELAREFRGLRGTEIAVYHREYVYLANRFGFRIATSIEEKPGVPPSASYLKKIIEQIEKQKIKTILISPYNNRSYADRVAARTGAEVIVAPVSVGSMEGATTYEKTIASILENIRRTLD